jgi:hypothetical protein
MRSQIRISIIAAALGGCLPAAAAGQPVLLPESFLRVRADNHFGVVKQHEVFIAVAPASGDSIEDTEIGTSAIATNSATYEITLGGTTVFGIQSQHTYSVGANGNLSEGFILFTTNRPYIYELSGGWSGTSTDAGDALQQRTFLRQFVSPFTTIFLEDEIATGSAVALAVNQSNDTGGGTYNQSGPRVGVLPPGTYEFMYELEGMDLDNDQAGSGASIGSVRLVLRDPLPPTRLHAVTNGPSVALSWTGSADATSYQLEAGSSVGASNLFNADIGNATQLQASVPAGSYFVRLRSKRSGLTGPPSGELTFTIGQPSCTAAPPAPTAHIVETGPLRATLEWGSSAGATSYVVEAGSGSGLANLLNANVGGRTFLASPAPVGSYFTRVRAVNACGTSGPSNEASFSVACNAPAVPTGVNVARSPGQVTLLWSASAGASSYVLQAGTSSGASNAFNGNIGGGTSVTFATAGIPAGTYFVRVIAVGVCGSSAPSAEVTITLP